MNDQYCPQCHGRFTPKSPTHKFCTKRCGEIWRAHHRQAKPQTACCLTCGKEFSPKNGNHKYCSRECNPSYIAQKGLNPKPNGENRPFTRDTLMWIDLWLRRGESVGQIAHDLGRSVENVLFAKSEIARIKRERGSHS